jgi:hypothetical protein
MAMNRTQVAALDRFKRATASAVPRIIGASSGEYGSGKTHFWLGAPGPIVIMSFDKGLEGVVEKYQDEKEIRIAEYEWEPTDDSFDQEEAIKLRDQFIEDFYFAAMHARTVIWDKETDIWNLVRYSEFGGPSERPNNFDRLNQRMRKYVNHPKKLTINFGLVQSLKDEWVSVTKANGKEGGASTGNRKKAGFKEVDGLVNVVLSHESNGDQFSVTVEKARGIGSAAVQNKTFPNMTFSELGMALFPDTDVPDWK